METLSLTFKVNKLNIFNDYQNYDDDNQSSAFESSIEGTVIDSEPNMVTGSTVKAVFSGIDQKLESRDYFIGKCTYYGNHLYFDYAIPFEDWQRILDTFKLSYGAECTVEISVLLDTKEITIESNALPTKKEINILCIESNITYEKKNT